MDIKSCFFNMNKLGGFIIKENLTPIFVALACLIILVGCNQKNMTATQPTGTTSTIAISTPDIVPVSSSTVNASKPTTETVASPKASEEKWEQFSEEDVPFTFKYPADWGKMDKSDLPNAMVKVIVGIKEREDFTTTVNVTMSDSPLLAPSAEQTVDQLVEYYKLYSANMGLTDFKKKSFESKDYGKYKAGILICTYTAAQTDTKVTTLQYIVPIGKTTYTLTATTLQSEFSRYDSILKEMIDSFKVNQ